jgi:ankyrin repeat protein
MPDKDIIEYALVADLKKVEEYIDNGDDINVTNRYGMTALIYASNNGHQAVVELLLAHDADINVTVSDGYTALMFASSRGHPAVVTSLIAHQAHINVTNDLGWSALMWACFYGKVECVKVLIQNQANLLLKSTEDWNGNKKGSSALDIAYIQRKKNTINELINAPDPDEINELHFYHAKQDNENIKRLTKSGIINIFTNVFKKKQRDIENERDRYGSKPFDINN